MSPRSPRYISFHQIILKTIWDDDDENHVDHDKNDDDHDDDDNDNYDSDEDDDHDDDNDDHGEKSDIIYCIYRPVAYRHFYPPK